MNKGNHVLGGALLIVPPAAMTQINSCCIDFRILLTLRLEVGEWRFDQRKSVTERFVHYS